MAQDGSKLISTHGYEVWRERSGASLSGRHVTKYAVPTDGGASVEVSAAEYQALVLTKILETLDELRVVALRKTES